MDHQAPCEEEEARRSSVLRLGGGVLVSFALVCMVAVGSSHPRAVEARGQQVESELRYMGATALAGMVETSGRVKADLKAPAKSGASAAKATEPGGGGGASHTQALPSGGTKVQGAPIVTINANGTVNVTQGETYIDNDTGAIGPDGKRTGAKADMPSFVMPVIFAGAGSVLLVLTCVYMNYFVKPEKVRKQPEPSRRQREGAA